MNRSTRAWRAWKRVAQRAAEVQAHVLFFLLYVVAVVPMGLLGVGRATRASKRRDSGDVPHWLTHEAASSAVDLESARRQS